MARKRTEQPLTAATERAAVEALVEAYRAVPPPTLDDWGDLSAFGDLGTRESMQRLDAEEICRRDRPVTPLAARLDSVRV